MVLRAYLIPALVALVLAGCGGEDWRTTDISERMPALDFDLMNEDGQAVTWDDYAGKPTLMFFGYTHCPDVCPTTLAQLMLSIRKLDPALRDDLKVLFISVDPKRDTPEILKTYTDAFGPQFIGLTGTKAQIDAVTNRYRVTYTLGDPDANGNYDVTHSSAVFAFRGDGKPAFLAIQSDPPSAITGDINTLVRESQGG